MLHRRGRWLGAVMTLLLAPLSAQGSLTTTFLGNNGLPSSGAGTFFDVEVKNRVGLKITHLDVNTYTATAALFQATVFVTPTSHVGSEMKRSRWSLVAAGIGRGAGQNKPSRVDVPDFFLAPGKYGLYISLAAAIGTHNCGPRYTNGTGRNQIYQNKDLVLRLGQAITRPFGGTLYKDRVWNGTIHYDRDDAGAFGSYGPGCAGSNGQVPMLGMTAAPRLNQTATFSVSNTLSQPSNAAVLLLGLPKTSIDLTALGAPGCVLHTNLVFVLGVPLWNGAGTWKSTVPNRPSLVSDIAHLQAAAFDPRANRLNFAFSNAISIRVGR